jgi:hypothetical protein
MKALYLIIFITFIFPLTSSYGKDWEMERIVGKVAMVYVSKEKENDVQVYKDAVNDLCKKGQFCMIMFWSNKKHIPTSFPMSDKQEKELNASYTFNPKTGYKKLLWNCRIVNDPSQCFSD